MSGISRLVLICRRTVLFYKFTVESEMSIRLKVKTTQVFVEYATNRTYGHLEIPGVLRQC